MTLPHLPIKQNPSGTPNAQSIPIPTGQWYAGVKYVKELDYPKYAFTFQLTFDPAGKLLPSSSWWKDGPRGNPRPIRSGSLLGDRLLLLYDAPNGMPLYTRCDVSWKAGTVIGLQHHSQRRTERPEHPAIPTKDIGECRPLSQRARALMRLARRALQTSVVDQHRVFAEDFMNRKFRGMLTPCDQLVTRIPTKRH